MLDFHTLTGRTDVDPLADVDAAEALLRALPQDNVFESQRRICAALATAGEWRKAGVDRFRALRALDARTKGLQEGLLSDYAALGAQSPALEGDFWRAASALCAAFADAFDHMLQLARATGPDRGWLERMPELVVRLLWQREVELTLSLCRYDPWPRARWKSVHALYGFAQQAALAREPAVLARRADESTITATPEQMYIRILLLQRVGSGTHAPQEIVWARRALARLSAPLRLRAIDAAASSPGENDACDAGAGVDPAPGFAVEPQGAEGLRRMPAAQCGGWLGLDTAPLVAAIDEELAGAPPTRDAADVSLALRWALLRRMKTLFAPGPVRVRRRGERSEAGLAHVQAAFGSVNAIYRVLRDEALRAAATAAASVPEVEEITITDTIGGPPPALRGASSRSLPGATPLGIGALLQSWQVRDVSDSGCLLRGRTLDARQLLPGTLMAFRADEVGAWTVAVVRRLRKMAGNNVELGVELIGRNPLRVILKAGGAPDAAGAPDAKPETCAGLYLPESPAAPRVPIATLVVPAHEFALGRVMTLVSTANERAIRLKEPLEQRLDFVWTSFEPVRDAPAGA